MIFAFHYATKLYAGRAANEKVIPQSLPTYSPEGNTCLLPSIPTRALPQALDLDFLPIPDYQYRQTQVNKE